MALEAFRQILTMIILLMVGMLCYKIGFIDEATNKKLSKILLLLVSPVVIFLSYQRPFDTELLHGLLIAFGLSAFSYAIALAVAHLIYRSKNGESIPIEKYACVYSNCGFIGIPLVYGVFGSEGVFYLTAFISMFNLLVWTHGIIVMSGNRSFAFFKKALVSPALIGVYLGFIFFIARIILPEVLLSPMRILGDTQTPLAMLIAGAAIAGTNLGRALKRVSLYKVCAIRLLLIPGLFILAARFLGLPDVIVGTVAIVTACPVAANIVLFANMYEKDYLYASELMAASTLLCMGTIPLMLMLL